MQKFFFAFCKKKNFAKICKKKKNAAKNTPQKKWGMEIAISQHCCSDLRLHTPKINYILHSQNLSLILDISQSSLTVKLVQLSKVSLVNREYFFSEISFFSYFPVGLY